MDSEAPFILVDANSAREEAQRLFEAVSKLLTRMLPPTADVRHIGETAVPGCLTKGDLDIVVRVPVDQFSDTDAVLASRFARNEGSIHSETFAAFEDASSKPHLGIQLVAINGPFDFFLCSLRHFNDRRGLSKNTTHSRVGITVPTWHCIERLKMHS